LALKRVSGVLIAIIALLVSVLMNLHNGLLVLGYIDPKGNEQANVSVSDIVLNFFYLFFVSWLILHFNANWRYSFKRVSLFLEILITLISHCAFLFITVNFLIFIYDYMLGDVLVGSRVGFMYFGYIIVFSVLYFVAKLMRYQVFREEDLLEKEALKKQSLENELTALKNQVNPHFLFNSLNSLSSLVRENEEATSFVTNLSYMYRYILQSSEKDLFTLKEELKFLESYIYLIKTRYRDRIRININISEKVYNCNIPVLTLQLLVENCVKHNEISVENPLDVYIYDSGNYLLVENKINPKLGIIESTGQGLFNIDKRYLLLKGKHISISNLNAVFKVKLPLK